MKVVGKAIVGSELDLDLSEVRGDRTDAILLQFPIVELAVLQEGFQLGCLDSKSLASSKSSNILLRTELCEQALNPRGRDEKRDVTTRVRYEPDVATVRANRKPSNEGIPRKRRISEKEDELG